MTEHAYNSTKYNSRTRWMNFWHQVDEVMALRPQTVLEVGKGAGIVASRLSSLGCKVTVVDIDPGLKPDIVASVEKIPVPDGAYDVVLAAEILEHLPLKRVPGALRELRRVGQRVVVTLPHAGTALIARLRVPWGGDYMLFMKIPFFWKAHSNKYGDFRGHYWELGKRGYPRSRARKLFREAGFQILKERIWPDDFIHIFFVLE